LCTLAISIHTDIMPGLLQVGVPDWPGMVRSEKGWSAHGFAIVDVVVVIDVEEGVGLWEVGWGKVGSKVQLITTYVIVRPYSTLELPWLSRSHVAIVETAGRTRGHINKVCAAN
jgi:hypothetical protein